MSAEKFSASMDDELLARARSDADARGVSLSSWLADAVSDRLCLQELGELVADWEAEHGVITAEEIDAFDQKLGAAAKQRSGAKARRSPRRRVAS